MFGFIRRIKFWLTYPRHLPHPATREFLDTYEWATLHYKALKKYGGRCMACGRTAKHGVAIHVDHIKPRKTHPHLALNFDNLQILCEDDNHGKGNWDSTDWR